MVKIGICMEVTNEQCFNFMHKLEKKKIEYCLITEWGCTHPKNSKFVVEFGSDDEFGKYWIATIDCLQTSKDGIFLRLMKDGKKEELPELKDVMRLREYHPDGTIIDKPLGGEDN